MKKDDGKTYTALLAKLKSRFESNMDRHIGLSWVDIKAKLEKSHEKLCSLNEMERTGGEPDVVAYDKTANQYHFFDCSPESPKGRRSICYDLEALKGRKEFKPSHSAIAMAQEMKIEVLTEVQYRYLQTLGHFDNRTSSWLLTPINIRKLKGAIFGDYRYGEVFIYHNGAESYYASRGFRGILKV